MALPKNPTQLEVVKEVNDKADDSAVVHKTGNETIGGNKTFSSAISAPNFNTRFATQSVPFGTYIGENANLNSIDYIRVGNYYCGANAVVATQTNVPTSSAYMMTVYSPLSTTVDNETTGTWVYRVRKLMTYTGEEYIQQVDSGATAGTFNYREWKKIPQGNTSGKVNEAGYADNAGLFNGKNQSTSGAYFNAVPVIGGDGVMECGKYFDMHNSSTETADYSTRLQCNGNGNTLQLPTANGTLALTSDIPTMPHLYQHNIRMQITRNTDAYSAGYICFVFMDTNATAFTKSTIFTSGNLPTNTTVSGAIRTSSSDELNDTPMYISKSGSTYYLNYMYNSTLNTASDQIAETPPRNSTFGIKANSFADSVRQIF